MDGEFRGVITSKKKKVVDVDFVGEGLESGDGDVGVVVVGVDCTGLERKILSDDERKNVCVRESEEGISSWKGYYKWSKLTAKAPYLDGVLIAMPRRSHRPQLWRTLAMARAPTSSTSE